MPPERSFDDYGFLGEANLPERQQRILQCLSCLRNPETGLIDADLRNANLCAGVTSLQRYRLVCELRAKGILEYVTPDDPEYPKDLDVKDHRRIDRITDFGEEKLQPDKVCGFSRDKYPRAYNPYKDVYGGTSESRREVLDCIRCLGAQGLGVTHVRIARCNGMHPDAVRSHLEAMVARNDLQILPEKELDLSGKARKLQRTYGPTNKTADILVPDEMPGCSEYNDELAAVLDKRSPTQLAILDGLRKITLDDDKMQFALSALTPFAPDSSTHYFVDMLRRASFIEELPRDGKKRRYVITDSGALLLALRAAQVADDHE
jgi:hypothetical protein